MEGEPKKKRSRARVGKKQQVGLLLPPEVVVVLDKAIAKAPGWSRNALIQHCIEETLRDGERDADALAQLTIETKRLQAQVEDIAAGLLRLRRFHDFALRYELKLGARTQVGSYDEFMDLLEGELNEHRQED